MFLAADIGNSDIVLGIWSENTWVHTWRIPTMPDEPEVAYVSRIHSFFLENAIAPSALEQVVISSVVPVMVTKIKQSLASVTGLIPYVLGPEWYDLLPLQIRNPFEIGPDLVANALAAYTRYQEKTIVVDFGTALTFTTLTEEGHILGIAIAPGLKTAIKALSQNTARLFEVPLQMPQSPLGHNTAEAIQAGILFGYEGLVRSIVYRIREELDENCIAVATGGMSGIITTLGDVFFDVVPTLTLDGIRLAGQIMRSHQPTAS
jgi:type III pantothenate kinase